MSTERKFPNAYATVIGRGKASTDPDQGWVCHTVDRRPSWLDESLYPFRSHYININGCRIHYVDEGNGPTILFLHPGPAWSFFYRNFIKGLRDRFRCIALDYPGFGFSTATESFRYNLTELSKVVEEFVKALDLQDFTLMVHDSSGPIGLGMASRQSERIKALIISDTFAWPLDQYPQVTRMIELVTSPPFQFLNRTFNLLPRITSAIGPRRRKLSEEERKAYTEAFPTPETRQRILAVFRSLVDQGGYLREVEQGLDRIKNLPALLMFGEHDPEQKLGFMQRFERTFPCHRSVVIKGETHFPHEGAPDETVATIRDWWTLDVFAAEEKLFSETGIVTRLEPRRS